MFKNLTPHDITILVGDKKIFIPVSGDILRLQETVVERGLSDEGVPVISKTYSLGALPERIDTPEPVNYIVSALVLAQIPADRPDFCAPDTGPTAIRDGNGQIMAVTRVISSQA